MSKSVYTKNLQLGEIGEETLRNHRANERGLLDRRVVPLGLVSSLSVSCCFLRLETFLHVSLPSNLYKWVPAARQGIQTEKLGITLRWTNISLPGAKGPVVINKG